MKAINSCLLVGSFVPFSVAVILLILQYNMAEWQTRWPSWQTRTQSQWQRLSSGPLLSWSSRLWCWMLTSFILVCDSPTHILSHNHLKMENIYITRTNSLLAAILRHSQYTFVTCFDLISKLNHSVTQKVRTHLTKSLVTAIKISLMLTADCWESGQWQSVRVTTTHPPGSVSNLILATAGLMCPGLAWSPLAADTPPG